MVSKKKQISVLLCFFSLIILTRHVTEFETVLDSGFHAVDSGF